MTWRGVGARDEGGAARDELLHRVDRLVDRALRVGLAFEADRRRGRGLLLRQAIDQVVHDDVGHVDVLARAVIEMIAADGEAVAVAAEHKDVQIGPGEADAAGERHGAAVDEMRAVAVDEIREARGAADAGEGDDLLVLDLAFLDELVIEASTAKSPQPGHHVGWSAVMAFLVSFSRGGSGGQCVSAHSWNS